MDKKDRKIVENIIKKYDNRDDYMTAELDKEKSAALTACLKELDRLKSESYYRMKSQVRSSEEYHKLQG